MGNNRSKHHKKINTPSDKAIHSNKNLNTYFSDILTNEKIENNLAYSTEQSSRTLVNDNHSIRTEMASNSSLSNLPDHLVPKTNSIYDDYLITDEVLGTGVNGSVLACIHKLTNVKYALKVNLFLLNE